MIKKLLILPLIGGLMSITAFASADTVDGFISDTDICSVNISNSSSMGVGDLRDSCSDLLGYDYDTLNVCFNVSPIGYYRYDNSNNVISYNGVVCPSDLEFGDYSFFFYSDSNKTFQNVSGKFYMSVSPITYNSSSDDSNSGLGIPEIPSSFTSGLTSLVNNFGGTIANWLPTIILIALGITAIFALFRVVRNYARSSFRG